MQYVTAFNTLQNIKNSIIFLLKLDVVVVVVVVVIGGGGVGGGVVVLCCALLLLLLLLLHLASHKIYFMCILLILHSKYNE